MGASVLLLPHYQAINSYILHECIILAHRANNWMNFRVSWWPRMSRVIHFFFSIYSVFLTMFCNISIHINIDYVLKSKQLTVFYRSMRHFPVWELCRRSLVTKAVTIRASNEKIWCNRAQTNDDAHQPYTSYTVADMALLSMERIKTRNCLSCLQAVLSPTWIADSQFPFNCLQTVYRV